MSRSISPYAPASTNICAPPVYPHCLKGTFRFPIHPSLKHNSSLPLIPKFHATHHVLHPHSASTKYEFRYSSGNLSNKGPIDDCYPNTGTLSSLLFIIMPLFCAPVILYLQCLTPFLSLFDTTSPNPEPSHSFTTGTWPRRACSPIPVAPNNADVTTCF